jgi:hypothetical protein
MIVRTKLYLGEFTRVGQSRIAHVIFLHQVVFIDCGQLARQT